MQSELGRDQNVFCIKYYNFSKIRTGICYYGAAVISVFRLGSLLTDEEQGFVFCSSEVT